MKLTEAGHVGSLEETSGIFHLQIEHILPKVYHGDACPLSEVRGEPHGLACPNIVKQPRAVN